MVIVPYDTPKRYSETPMLILLYSFRTLGNRPAIHLYYRLRVTEILLPRRSVKANNPLPHTPFSKPRRSPSKVVILPKKPKPHPPFQRPCNTGFPISIKESIQCTHLSSHRTINIYYPSQSDKRNKAPSIFNGPPTFTGEHFNELYR